MHGKILDYNSDMKSGFIRGENGRKYHFFIGDCTNPEQLQAGAEADFEPESGHATKINVLEVAHNTSDENVKSKKSKKIMSAVMVFALVVGIAALIVTLIVSELEHRKLEKLQKYYDAQIQTIEKYIREGKCDAAAAEYQHAGMTRSEIYKKGAYYSFESHAVQAHSIDIAECFALRKEFADAIGMLDIESVNDVDYLRRASLIYKKSGDKAKAEEAASKAEKFVPIH